MCCKKVLNSGNDSNYENQTDHRNEKPLYYLF